MKSRKRSKRDSERGKTRITARVVWTSRDTTAIGTYDDLLAIAAALAKGRTA